MKTVYRVWFPLITMDGYRDFTNQGCADAFADERRSYRGPYSTMHDWRRVRVETIQVPEEVTQS